MQTILPLQANLQIEIPLLIDSHKTFFFKEELKHFGNLFFAKIKEEYKYVRWASSAGVRWIHKKKKDPSISTLNSKSQLQLDWTLQAEKEEPQICLVWLVQPLINCRKIAPISHIIKVFVAVRRDAWFSIA